MRPFLVVGTPRSRTAWLAKFLSYGGRECLHEPSLRFSSSDCLKLFLQNDAAAASDSMMTFLCHQARSIRQDCIVVSVRRPLAEVRESFARLGLTVADWFLQMLDDRVEMVEEDLANLSVRFSDLEDEKVCKDIFEGCLRTQFDKSWWRSMKDLNIQSDVRSTLTLLRERDADLARVFRPHYHA